MRKQEEANKQGNSKAEQGKSKAEPGKKSKKRKTGPEQGGAGQEGQEEEDNALWGAPRSHVSP